MRCGLLGRHLGHSYSPEIHAFLADYDYGFFEVEPEDLGDFLEKGQFDGLNVTIPYKKEVISYCAELSPRARQLGAVNTIVRRADGSLIGHNTDYFGLEATLEKSGLDVKGKKALVLGSGGASNTAVAVLQAAGAHTVVISRKGENNYNNLDLHADAAVIVNATPVGMYPDVGKTPLRLDHFPQLEGVIDVIYNPARTQILLDAEERGLVAMNGLWMLVAQAKESCEWFTGNKLPDSAIHGCNGNLQWLMENVILIGMPGCGKSAVGRAVAQEMGRFFVDADEEIEKLAGKSIPEIFAQDGEEVFRDLEMQVLMELGKQSGLVIATGGGCVTRPENYNHLHQNGQIFWLRRALYLLETQGRPLSMKGDLGAMFEVRKPMYQRFSDYEIDNNGAAEGAVTQIISIMRDLK